MAYWEFDGAPVRETPTSFGNVRLCGYDADDVRTKMEPFTVGDKTFSYVRLILHQEDGSWVNSKYYPNGMYQGEDVQCRLESEISKFLNENPYFAIAAGKAHAKREIKELRANLARHRKFLADYRQSVERMEQEEAEMVAKLEKLGGTPPPPEGTQIKLDGSKDYEQRNSRKASQGLPGEQHSRRPAPVDGSDRPSGEASVPVLFDLAGSV